MSRRELVGFAAVACVACCIGPILGVLGGIAALGLSGGDEERPAQETVPHRLQLDAPFGLALVELVGAE